MAQLKITRLKEWTNRYSNYKIIIDGQEELEIANGQEKIITVDSAKTIQAKLMWCGSRSIDLTTDKEHIKEVRVKANKRVNVAIPFIALAILMLSNLSFFNNELKTFMTGLTVGMLVYLIGILTIGRNRFLEIELVKG